ncbi:alpha/beta hydrolase [Pontibacter litorisediminis]|uniref:alpha/beta hydrolase n=1 Tax=Pontibacter litorisediminis TaxID=1846260 RepID=UPI0023ED649C|nr:alpha/beta hydrolase [Pontibacter litorisediminis]
MMKRAFIKSTLLLLLLAVTLDCYALKPARAYVATPDSLGMRYAQQVLSTPDGYRLNTWLIPPSPDRDNRTTLVLSYADSGNMSYWLYHIKALSEAGFTVVAFDYRGFGESSDFEIDPLHLYYNEFATDLATVLKWAKESVKGNSTGVLAFSMGTIVATHALQREKAGFLIGEGFVHDPGAYVARIKETKGRAIALPAGAHTYTSKLKKLKCPMLLVAGEQDAFTTVADNEQVARQRANREVLTHSGNHTEGFMALTEESFGDQYIKAVMRFTQKLIK